jgi:Cu/Ag efflux protein CusF
MTRSVSGFEYDLAQKAIIIPSGTPFSKLQRLFDTLPKALKYTSDSRASIDIMFEDGNYINDLGTFLVLRDFSYQINIKSLSNKVDGVVGTYVKPVIFQSDKAIEIYNSAVNFTDIRFEYLDAGSGAIAFLNSTTNIDDCCFDAKVNQSCVFDRGYNKIVFSDTYFKMNRDIEDTILDKASVGSFINIARSKSAPDFRPKTIVQQISGGLIIAGNVEDLLISEKSPVYMPNGGIEVHGGFVTDPDGNLNISVPTKLSQLENDMNLTANFEELQNKPTTITAEQATAIENNNRKNSYPQADAEKLAGIEEGATAGADWKVNVQNKPVTITEEQSAAIEANTQKRTYPEADENKLATVEENATSGADWNENVQNKPVTISSQQAADIEANNAKRSYPQADEDKLATIEENATAGADWSVNVQNKPVTITEEQATAIEANTQKVSYPQVDAEKLAGIEEGATVGADWSENVQNKPVTITEEQAAAIEANTEKVSYPQADSDKLAGIEEGATVGADWSVNVQNKPVTITEEQAAAIEANTQKVSYPQADADKLAGIEEGATAGADWSVNVQNKPVTISAEQAAAIETNAQKVSYPQADAEKLAGIEEGATVGADWGTNLQNIPALLTAFLTKLAEEGVTRFDIEPDGTTLRLGHDHD